MSKQQLPTDETSQEDLQEVVDKGAEGLGSPQNLTKEEIRNRLVSNLPVAESKPITLFGVDLIIKQPPLKEMLRMRDEDDTAKRAAEMIVKYAVNPTDGERVFEDADIDMILNWPFGKDVAELNTIISELTGIDIDAAEEGLKSDPLVG